MKITKAVILAGGMGSRMAPASRVIAKEMLPVVDRPVMDFLVEDLFSAGVTDILVVSNKNKTCIQNFFNNTKVKFSFVFQDAPLGVSDALMLAKTFVSGQPFFLIYGDVLFSAKPSSILQMLQTFKQTKTSVVGTRKVSRSKIHLYGCLGVREVDGQKFVTSIIEKPEQNEAPSNVVLAGQFVLMPEIFNILEKAKAGELFTDCLLCFAKDNNLAVCEINGKCFDIGSKLGYVMAIIHFAMEHKQIKREIKRFLYSFNKK